MMVRCMKIATSHKNLSAAIILILVILAAFSPVIFLGQSYNLSYPISPSYVGYEGKKVTYLTTIDPGADYQQNWPVLKLESKLILDGKLPLWNPYMGGGAPLAADTDSYIFSPINLGFLLPIQFWDYVLFSALWVAGISTFLFLRNLGLNFISSLTGGIFYLLSGAFTWYLPHTPVPTMMFTPLLLYLLDKIVEGRNPKYILLTSIIFSLSVLGAHLESLALQFVFVGLYLCYRVLHLTFSNYSNKQRQKIIDSCTMLQKNNVRRILMWSIAACIGGLALSAFFILPVYEFLHNGVIGRDTTTGIAYNPLYVLSTNFVPYVMGPVQSYWSSEMASTSPTWNTLGGYVGVSSLFFSILGVFLSLKNKSNLHRYTPLFFILVSVFFMLKTTGNPLANWIGYLPVLNHVVFPRYDGFITPICFAIAAAFGINFLSKEKTNLKILGLTCLASILIILLLLIPLSPYLLSSNAKFSSGVSFNDAKNYVGFQIVQAIVFALVALFLSIIVSRNKSTAFGIIPVVLLELFLYIPVGLNPIWMAYKFIIVISGIAIISLVLLRSDQLLNCLHIKNMKHYVMVGILAITVLGGVLLSEYSPFGMMQKYDSFKQNDLTDFLKNNLGNSRMFSFDGPLGPNYPSAYEISTLDLMSASNIGSFYSFNNNFLARDGTTTLGWPGWRMESDNINAVAKFFEDKKYFDFLGVKYVVTDGYDISTIMPGPPISASYVWISKNENSMGESFVSPINDIRGIGISFGTALKENHGRIIFTIDSVPVNSKFHRESVLDAENVKNGDFNQFDLSPPLNDTYGKKFYFSLKYPEASQENTNAVFLYDNNSLEFNNVENKFGGQFFENGTLVKNKEMVFSIIGNQTEYPIVYQFHAIRVTENTNVFPRAFLVNMFSTVDYDKAQDFLLNNTDFDLRHNVVLERKLPSDEINSLKSSVLDDKSTASITSYSANDVKISVQSKGSAFLLLTDTYYPGWKAYVDGKESVIYRADGLVRAVFVPAGNHIVEFYYMPNSFVVGAIISVVTAISLVGFYIYSRRKSVMKSRNKSISYKDDA